MPSPPAEPPPAATAAPDQIAAAAEHLFRHEAGRLVATLTRIFGVQHLNLAEDVVQEALVKALQTWPYYGVPANPSAWLTQVARNLALDVVRRDKLFRDKESAVITHLETISGEAEAPDAVVFDEEIRDNRLRLLFVCCHPEIPQDSQGGPGLEDPVRIQHRGDRRCLSNHRSDDRQAPHSRQATVARCRGRLRNTRGRRAGGPAEQRFANALSAFQ
jgi:RNA polymerase sigma-70 factor (ECF subfamily)